jgi:hypothetical protein
MTIRKPLSGPVDGEHVVRRALDFFSGVHGDSDPLGGASTTQFSEPIPVYRIDLDKIHGENFMDAARFVGCRYLLGPAEKESAVAVADVRKDETDETALFSRVTRGGIAQRLWDATMLASETYGDRPEQYDIRIIDIPALQRSALWLRDDRGHNDVFFLIYSGKSDARKVHEEPSFVKDVVGAASNYRSRRDQAIAN